jgi:C4-dicarboxylate-specific signal transduction histidine kinase
MLTALLLPAFAQLYWRSRDTRTLLWLLGFLFAFLRMLQSYQLGLWNLADAHAHPWVAAAGLTFVQISSGLFLASLSPLTFRIGQRRILYVIPFTLPLTLYAFLLYVRYNGALPPGIPFLLFPALGALSLLVGCFWAFARGSMPTWLGLALCIFMGGAGLLICVRIGGAWPLLFVECALHLTTALLVFYVFRRLSPGTFLAGAGFIAWSLNFADIVPPLKTHALLQITMLRMVSLGAVVAAIGMILLALEDQLDLQRTSQMREQRARKELEAYTRLTLSRRRLDDFDRQGPQICQTVVENSCFEQSALILLRGSSQFRLAGTAGFADSTINAIESLVSRIPVEEFLAPGSTPIAVAGSHSYSLNLRPWLLPGDDLERLRFTEVIAVPLPGRQSAEGAILLSAQRDRYQSLRSEDLMSVEVLASRIQSARSQTLMLEKLVESEKFASLGQLASNVTWQLNNPLTVILGYASLLEAAENKGPQEIKAVEAILAEARNIRTILESLSRMSRNQPEEFSAVSVTELLNDIEQLHRSEFVHRSIDFRLRIAPGVPRVLGNPQQVRQAVLYCLQFAIEAVEGPDSGSERSVQVDATASDEMVKIVISHSGAGFLHPNRTFDSFVPVAAAGETAGLGLNLCATILRENSGRISAVNLEPRGAALILELQSA